ncbi:MAG: chemotaxis protein CheC [Candidatus Omnitrophota bacterium]
MKQSLQEINKIAAEETSLALKKLFKQNVELKIPMAKVSKVEKLKPIVDPEEMTVGIYLPISGDAKGAALLIIPREAAFTLSEILLEKNPGSTRKLTRLDKAALKEVGNIICGQYFTVFSNMLGVKLIEHIPNLSYSMFGSIISDIIARFSRISDEALVIELNIIFKPKVIKIYFLLLFEPIKITRLLK